MNEAQNNRQHNLDMCTGRVSGKYLEGGVPRGGGTPKEIVHDRTLYQPIDIPQEEIFSRLGLLPDVHPDYMSMTPAVEEVNMQTAVIFDISGIPTMYERRFFDANGNIERTEEYPLRGRH